MMKAYPCNFCEKSFARRQSRHTHIKLEHPEEAMSKKRTREEVVSVEEEPGRLKDHQSGAVLAYRSSIEVLKSCGIEGKELETAMLVSII